MVVLFLSHYGSNVGPSSSNVRTPYGCWRRSCEELSICIFVLLPATFNKLYVRFKPAAVVHRWHGGSLYWMITDTLKLSPDRTELMCVGTTAVSWRGCHEAGCCTDSRINCYIQLVKSAKLSLYPPVVPTGSDSFIVWRRHDSESATTHLHAFVTDRIDSCRTILLD